MDKQSLAGAIIGYIAFFAFSIGFLVAMIWHKWFGDDRRRKNIAERRKA